VAEEGSEVNEVAQPPHVAANAVGNAANNATNAYGN
jgi:hypothetical protein